MQIRKGLKPYWHTIDDARFEIKPLTSPEIMELATNISRSETGRAYFTACELAITNWEGLKDVDGADVAFSVDDIKYLDGVTAATLAGVIISDNKLSKADEKNSSAQSK